MSKSVLLALTLPLGLYAGCVANQPEYEETLYPDMTLAQGSLEFGDVDWGATVERTVLLSNQGEMPMGVGSIELGDDEVSAAFTIAYATADIVCPESEGDDTGSAKSVSVDTGPSGGDDTGGGGGGGGGGGDDTGGGGGGGGGTIVQGALFVLDPGCEIPLTVTYAPVAQGDAYNAMIIESVRAELTADEEKAGDLPVYLDDPVHTSQVVYLHGSTDYEQGAVVVRPRSYDFGFVHPDAADAEGPARIQIANVGDGDVNVTGVALSDTCTNFVLTTTFDETTTLEGGQQTLAEVTFTPSDTDPAYCQAIVYTDDVANPEIDVTLTGNSGSDPENVLPTVYIRSPENGYRYNAINPLVVELNIFDENQPATSLVCRVKSAVLQEVTVATCDATDESGHVFVEIDPENLVAGTDTLLVTVTDGSQTSAYASVSVVINASYPEDDDDGDGFSPSGDADGLNADCDDDNVLTYPEAAEIYDLQDNDCDGVTDEGTEGYDDDGDNVSELEGDCNDNSEDVYPEAPERGDGLDNDCDGTADESTSLYDDDGDGYAEVNNDCDDTNADINPSASEICDGEDNDCDGLRDSADGCVETEAEPIVVGNTIRMEQSACLEFEAITMDILVFDSDNDTLTYLWSTEGAGTFDNAAAAVVNFTAPEISGDTANAGRNENIYALVTDEDGQDWAFGRIAVWDENTKLYDPYTEAIIEEADGVCGTTGASPVGAFALAGAALALAFRRRE